MTETDDFTTDSHREGNDKDLASELGKVREEINRRAETTDDEKEEELYHILALRLAETERHLEAIATAREPRSEFSFEDILDGIDEELVGETNGSTLSTQDEEISS